MVSDVRFPTAWLALHHEMVGVDSEHIWTSGVEAGVETQEEFHRWKKRKVVRRVQ